MSTSVPVLVAVEISRQSSKLVSTNSPRVFLHYLLWKLGDQQLFHKCSRIICWGTKQVYLNKQSTSVPALSVVEIRRSTIIPRVFLYYLCRNKQSQQACTDKQSSSVLALFIVEISRALTLYQQLVHKCMQIKGQFIANVCKM